MRNLLLLLTALLCFANASAQSDTVTISSFENFADIDDATIFNYDGEAITTYQNGKYLFVRSIVAKTDDDGNTSYYSYPALLYGSAKQTYTNGDIIPANWTGKKTTYKGMTEATTLKNMQPTTGQVDNADVWAAPVDYTGYIQYLNMSDFYTLLAGEYMSFEGVYITDVYRKEITITEVVDGVKYNMAAYNQFNIKLPSDLDVPYNITGFYYINDNTLQFLPVSIERYAQEDNLYTVVFGDDGEEYRIKDELYVVEPTQAFEPEEDSNNYIYVTDNLWELQYYSYTFDWIPTYIAIDCQGDENLYNKIAGMTTIKAGSLWGTLANSNTNPRLLVTEAPTASDNTTELRYRNVNLDDTIVIDGHDVITVTATYKVIDGQEYLMGQDETANLWQPIKLDRRYMGDVQLQDGEQYVFERVVVKLQEEWDSSDPITHMQASGNGGFQLKPLLRQGTTAPARAARRMNPDDPCYYDNIVLCPLEGTPIHTGVTEVSNAAKQVTGIEYVNIAGQTSSTPHDGVNIVVTHYSDGSTTASKVIR